MRTSHVSIFMRVFLALLGALMAVSFSALAATNYTVTVHPGFNVIANQLENGGNNINQVLTNIPGPCIVYHFNADTGALEQPQQYISGSGWVDMATSAASTMTLVPGDGAVFYNPLNNPFDLTFSGNVNASAQLQQQIGCGTFSLHSRQTNGIGTFENITLDATQEGSQIYIHTGGGPPLPSVNPENFTIYTYLAGAWSPSLPMVPVGAAAFVRQLCGGTGCINITASNLFFVSSTFVNVNLSNALSSTVGCQAANVLAGYICRPPSGSAFALGSTPVHAIGVDILGNYSSADFYVTVSPPPITAPFSSNGVVIKPGSTNLIANQFNRGGNNLGEIIPIAPDGCTVTKYNNASGTWSQSVYKAAMGAWVPANIALNPGEGAFLSSPVGFVLRFSGVNPTPVLPLTLNNSGIGLVSLQTNGLGTYDAIMGQPPVNNSTVYKLAPSGAYNRYTFNAPTGIWTDQNNNTVPPPLMAQAQSCWISINPSVQPPIVPIAPQIITQPTNVTVPTGSNATFTVVAAGSGPLNYQWRHNGQFVPSGKNAFTVVNSQPTNAGNYSVTVFNSIGSVTSSNAVLTPGTPPFLQLSDKFATALNLGSAFSGSLTGNNIGASVEPGEPSPGNIPGGASVWAKWVAKGASGIATFNLAGSSFDTLLAVYTGTNINQLTPVVFDDDSAGFQNSQVSFNAAINQTYMIQIDGFYGATGQIVLNFGLTQTGVQLPVIVTPPTNVTTFPGGTAVFSVQTQAGFPVGYQWMKDGSNINGANNSTLVISPVADTSVGTYQVKLTTPGTPSNVVSFPAELQINSIGSTVPPTFDPGTRAEDKFFAASDSTVRPGDPYDPTLVTGYTATQVFGTYGAGVDDSEPLHCGASCTFTKWNAYTPPSSGLLTIKNTGTTFAGVLAVYTGPPTNYGTLTPVACSAGHGVGSEIVSFQATGGTAYWVLMGATNITNGTVHLQYTTTTPPFFTLLPVSQGVGQGSNANLTTATTGNPSATYQWRINGTNIPGATTTALPLNNFKLGNQGDYSIVAANTYGTNTFSYASVYLNSGLQLINTTNVGNTFFTQLLGMPNSNYDIQVSSNLQNWTTVQTGNSMTGIQNYTETNYQTTSNRLFRAALTQPPQ